MRPDVVPPGQSDAVRETAVENTGQFPTDVPLLVHHHECQRSAGSRRGRLTSPDGVPLYDFTGSRTRWLLDPRSLSGLLSMFHNPNQTQFTYDAFWASSTRHRSYYQVEAAMPTVRS